MKTIKHKPKNTKLNTFDKALRTKEKVRGVSSKVKENIPDGNEKNMNEYASDNVMEKGSYAVHKTIEITDKTIRKGYNAGKEYIQNKPKTDKNTKRDTKKKQAHYAQKEQAKKSYKKQQSSTEIINNKDIDANERNIKTKQSTIKRDIKTKNKPKFKKNSKTIKATKNKIKTADTVAKKTAINAKKSVQKAKRSAEISRQTAKATVKTVKAVAKALYSAAKTAVAVLKSVVAAIAAGGWIVVVVIVVIALIVILVSSPWGIFFDDTDDETPTITELVIEINNDYNNKIIGIITNAGEIDEIIIEGDSDSGMYVRQFRGTRRRYRKHFIYRKKAYMSIYITYISANRRIAHRVAFWAT